MMQKGLLILAILVFISESKAVVAQSEDSSFSWFGEFVSFDQSKNTVTAKAPIQKHVVKYIDRFKFDESITIVWSQYNHEGDVVSYVQNTEAMSAGSGYITHAKYISSDLNNQTLTFATSVAEGAMRTLAEAVSGTPIKVASSMVQSELVAAVVGVGLNETPQPRPEPVTIEVLVWDGIEVAGEWTLQTNLMGNDVNLTCSFTQEGPKLGGSCSGQGPMANLELDGDVEDNEVSFQFGFDAGGISVVLLHTGVLNSDGTMIEGTLDLFGNETAFSMVRQ